MRRRENRPFFTFYWCWRNSYIEWEHCWKLYN